MKKSFLFKRGSIYQLQYFDENEQRIKRVSTRKNKKSDAIKFLMEFEQNRKCKSQIKFILLSNFAKEYKLFIENNYSKSHFKTIQTTFKKLMESIGDMPLNKITNRTLETFFTEYYKKTKHGASLFYRLLNAAFNKAIVWNYLEINPMNKIRPPKIPYNNPLFIDESELNQILENVDNQTLKDFYVFSFHTGMRLSEVINLKWNQVSLSDRLIRVINTEEFTTKGKKERVILINEKLFKQLSNKIPKYYNLQNPGYVFNSNGFRFNRDYVSKKFKKAVRDTKNIDSKLHLHNLRHSFASNLAKNGVSLFIIKELLGHQDIRTSQIYSHLIVDSLRNAVKVLES